MLPGTYTFKIDGFDTDIAISGCSTAPKVVMVKLVNSSGVGISGGVVDVWAINNSPAYSNNVVTINSSGNAVILFPETVNDHVYFRMNYANAKQQLGHFNINNTTTVTFTTRAVTLRLLDSNGSPIRGANADYFSSSYQQFGTTDASGSVVKELLPFNAYYFRMSYNGFKKQKGPINVNSDLTVNYTYSGSEISSVAQQYTKKTATLAGHLLVNPGLTEMEPTTVIPSNTNVPSSITKFSAYPNPFTSTATISYVLTSEQPVQMDVYNANGMKMQTLLQGDQPEGYHTTTLNALNLPQGVYYVRLLTKGGISQIPIILTK